LASETKSAVPLIKIFQGPTKLELSSRGSSFAHEAQQSSIHFFRVGPNDAMRTAIHDQLASAFNKLSRMVLGSRRNSIAPRSIMKVVMPVTRAPTTAVTSTKCAMPSMSRIVTRQDWN